MYYWGVGLHKISLGSLIIALGLLVDDAIIAVEMMVRKLEEGYDKMRAATFAYEITAMPMLTGTLITAAGFLPIGTGQVGRPANTPSRSSRSPRLALLISWLVVGATSCRYLGAWLLQAQAARRGGTTSRTSCSTRRSTRAFARLVNWCVRAPLDHDRRSPC